MGLRFFYVNESLKFVDFRQKVPFLIFLDMRTNRYQPNNLTLELLSFPLLLCSIKLFLQFYLSLRFEMLLKSLLLIDHGFRLHQLYKFLLGLLLLLD